LVGDRLEVKPGRQGQSLVLDAGRTRHTPQLGYTFLPAACDLLELAGEHLRGVRSAPGVQVVVGEPDHRGVVTCRAREEEVRRAELLGAVVEHGAVVGELAEGRAERFPGRADLRCLIGP